MLFQRKLIQVIFLLLLLTFPICVELASCQAPPLVDSTGEEERAELRGEIDGLKSELSEIPKLKKELSALRKEHFDLQSEMAQRHLDWASYVLASIALLVALFTAIMAYIINQRFRDVNNIYGSTIKEVSEHKVKIIESQRTIDDVIRKSKEDYTTSKKELESLRDDFAQQLEKSKAGVQNLIKEQIQTVSDNARRIVNKEADRFRQTTKRSSVIVLNSAIDLLEKAGVVVEKDKLVKARDEIFKANLHLFDLDSYVADLTSDDKNERFRAIWGIEGMATEETVRDLIKELQKIADNKDEDPDVRVEAQRSIDNLKRRFGIQ